ncbi:MAG: nuclear transport factor 2 family protein [Verrucomicrobia bacterium]|nr:nuclear transport factor 2 family protein [Verrucomicrobiota bacterium]
MSQTTASLAKAYYTAYHNKDLGTIERLLHPNVQFVSPLAQLQGKAAVFESVQRFLTVFTSLTVREVFGSQDQAMVVYDTGFAGLEGMLPASVLMTFKEGLVSRLELFFDARLLEPKRAQVFSS